MYRLLQFIFISVLLTTSVQAEVQAPPPLEMEIPYGSLTLRQAQQMAIDASPSVAETVACIDAAKAVVEQARATMMPQISTSVGLQHQEISGEITIDELSDYGLSSIDIDTDSDVIDASLQVSWLLFDGYSRKASILAAEAQTKATIEVSNEARRLLVKAVASAYYQAQLAAEGMQIAQQNRLFNRNLESDADKRWQAGVIAEAEKLNFSVRALQAENDYLVAEQNFNVVCTVLAQLMALPDARLTPEFYPCTCTLDELAALPDFDDEFTYALEQRPDLQALNAGREALQLKKEANEGSFYPKVGLGGGYEYMDLGDTGNLGIGSVALSLSWDLYDGGTRSAKIRETQAQIVELNSQQQQKVLEVKSELRQTLLKAEAAQAVYQRQLYTLSLVQKIRDHIEMAYRAGAATLTRLNGAQTDLITVSAAVASSRINYLQQLESLKATSGRILEELQLPVVEVEASGFIF
jgi:outer membrane protein TolC